jgi:hypothetical protein
MTEPQHEALVVEDDFALDHDLETPLDDAFEQALPVNPDDLPERPDIPFEADEADAYEQSRPASPGHRADPPPLPIEANEADAYEQSIDVDQDDDYR